MQNMTNSIRLSKDMLLKSATPIKAGRFEQAGNINKNFYHKVHEGY